MTTPQNQQPDFFFVRARKAICEVELLVNNLLPTLSSLRGNVKIKTDNSPVTDADLLVEQEVEALLRKVLGELNFYGEESFTKASHSVDGWVAVLDPIDGTENFVSGLRTWGLSLTIWNSGTHVCSLLMLPELGERIVTGEKLEYFSSRITGFSSTISSELAAQLSKAGEVRISGCSVFNLISVIKGSYSRFVNPVGAYSWDLLAGVVLALEHECEVLIDDEPYYGAYLEPGKKYRVDVRHKSHNYSW